MRTYQEEEDSAEEYWNSYGYVDSNQYKNEYGNEMDDYGD